MVKIEIEGLDELRKKFAQFPDQYKAVMAATLGASLDTLTESVPPYPPANPDSSYIRTGTLGRSLGAGGRPDIYEQKIGAKMAEATWGTRVEYAPYVIGEKEQAKAHNGRWYTILTIAGKARPKIERLFEIATEKLAKWLNEQ